MPTGQLAPSKLLELTYELKVEEAMTTNVVAVSPRDSIADLRVILRDRRISGTPVVDGGALVGIVSLEDFIKCLVERRADSTVGERMTRTVHTISPDEPIVHAIQKFQRLGYGRFPVVDRATGKLVGIITKGDVMGCLLKRLESSFTEQEKRQQATGPLTRKLHAARSEFSFEWDVTGRNLAQAGECASQLKHNLLTLGFDAVVARRVGIATFEAEMNVAIFTPGGTITARVGRSAILVRVEDRGPGIPDVEQAMQPGYSTAPDWVRELGFGAGMGLPNIKTQSDDLTIDSQCGRGTTLEFVVRYNGGP